jgi:hypothetical protein
MSTVYVGLDVGSSHCHLVGVEANGRIIRNQQITTGEINLIQAFSELSGEIHVHLEASELAPWVRSCIASLVQRIVISHPRTNAWIAKDANKSDRVDAFKLAELLRGREAFSQFCSLLRGQTGSQYIIYSQSHCLRPNNIVPLGFPPDTDRLHRRYCLYEQEVDR